MLRECPCSIRARRSLLAGFRLCGFQRRRCQLDLPYIEGEVGADRKDPFSLHVFGPFQVFEKAEAVGIEIVPVGHMVRVILERADGFPPISSAFERRGLRCHCLEIGIVASLGFTLY